MGKSVLTRFSNRPLIDFWDSRSTILNSLLVAIDPFERISILTRILRTSAKVAKNARALIDPSGHYSRRNFLSATARAVFSNDFRLAHYLLKANPVVVHTISIDYSFNKVCLKEPLQFAAELLSLREQKNASLQVAICDSQSSHSQGDSQDNLPKKVVAKLSSLQALARLWFPKFAALSLHGLILNGSVLQDPTLINRALGSSWAPIFGAINFNLSEASSFLKEYCPSLPWSSAENIGSDPYRSFLYRVRDTGPGKDDSPYSFWRAAGEVAIDALYESGQELTEGTLPPHSFNDSAFLFPPQEGIYSGILGCDLFCA